MRSRSLLSGLASLSLSMLAVGCSGNNVIGTSSSSSGTSGSPTSSSSSSTGTSSGSSSGSTGTDTGSTGSTGSNASSSSGGSTGTPDPRATYPAPPYGVLINKTIQDFTFDGYAQMLPGTIAAGTPKANFSLSDVREWTNASGAHFKYLLLDVAAGWCGPCNNEADSIGAHGSLSTKVSEWQGKGGVVVTVLVQSYVEDGTAAKLSDIDTWNGAHSVQSSLAIDETGDLINSGISPAAFPFNAIVDLDTMKIVNAYYGDDATFAKFEAVLNAQH